MPDQPDPVDDEGELLAAISLLSSKAALFLTGLGHDPARLVVRELSLAIKYWEAFGVTLDPIQRETVIDSFVYAIGAVVVSFQGAVSDVARALQQHLAAGQVGTQLPDGDGSGSG